MLYGIGKMNSKPYVVSITYDSAFRAYEVKFSRGTDTVTPRNILWIQAKDELDAWKEAEDMIRKGEINAIWGR